ncbi:MULTISPECIES: hypothetical protein [Novosphingobium]|uniref:Uncharacterized protein n=1 Tax=Novosphingobium decolorationis TaxID=2698673 RepID=A0ABX8E624_9SPHN|nr:MULTISPECIES: hypothetical protein [Novosphingobium]QVM83666.1 hypothetical protein HT578_08135 [Novosphingobium decolorationis]
MTRILFPKTSRLCREIIFFSRRHRLAESAVEEKQFAQFSIKKQIFCNAIGFPNREVLLFLQHKQGAWHIRAAMPDGTILPLRH